MAPGRRISEFSQLAPTEEGKEGIGSPGAGRLNEDAVEPLQVWLMAQGTREGLVGDVAIV